MSLLPHYVGERNFASWFPGLTIASSSADRIAFGVRSPFYRDWMRDRYELQVLDCVRRICPTIERVEFVAMGRGASKGSA
jgi:hypothetical protein